MFLIIRSLLSLALLAAKANALITNISLVYDSTTSLGGIYTFIPIEETKSSTLFTKLDLSYSKQNKFSGSATAGARKYINNYLLGMHMSLDTSYYEQNRSNYQLALGAEVFLGYYGLAINTYLPISEDYIISQDVCAQQRTYDATNTIENKLSSNQVRAMLRGFDINGILILNTIELGYSYYYYPQGIYGSKIHSRYHLNSWLALQAKLNFNNNEFSYQIGISVSYKSKSKHKQRLSKLMHRAPIRELGITSVIQAKQQLLTTKTTKGFHLLVTEDQKHYSGNAVFNATTQDRPIVAYRVTDTVTFIDKQGNRHSLFNQAGDISAHTFNMLADFLDTHNANIKNLIHRDSELAEHIISKYEQQMVYSQFSVTAKQQMQAFDTTTLGITLANRKIIASTAGARPSYYRLSTNGVTDYQQVLSELALPSTPVVLPFFGTQQGSSHGHEARQIDALTASTAINSGLPTIYSSIQLPQYITNRWLRQAKANPDSILYGLQLPKATEVFIVLQDKPWRNMEAVLVRPHPWLAPDTSSNISYYKRMYTGSLAMEELISRTMLQVENDEERKIMLPDDMLFDLSDKDMSSIGYSIIVDDTRKRAAITLHALLSRQNARTFKEHIMPERETMSLSAFNARIRKNIAKSSALQIIPQHINSIISGNM